MDRVSRAAEEALQPAPPHLNINERADLLITQLLRIADATVPQVRQGPRYQHYKAPWWSPTIKEAVREARRAARSYRSTRSQADLNRLQDREAIQNRHIREAKRAH